jgi:hypothetical protein
LLALSRQRRGHEPCAYDIAAAEPAPERKINPETLTCEEFAWGSSCNDACGPCPQTGAGAAQYIPPWGHCESECSDLDEAQCRDAAACRIARDWTAFYEGQPSFEGCYERPIYEAGDPLPALCEYQDAEQCSRHAECAGLYRMNASVSIGAPRADFQGCVDEAQVAGTCTPATCRQVAPTCPASTTPGVANGCWTGSCIPNAFCH